MARHSEGERVRDEGTEKTKRKIRIAPERIRDLTRKRECKRTGETKEKK